jgi:ABC-type polysaccharide/polyol phosphate export permease
MIAELKLLYAKRELLWAMVERELRIRYKNSVLGFFWSLLNPLVTMCVMWVVFKFLLGNATPNYSAYVLSAYIPFMFFNMAVMDSAQSVLAALPVIKKVSFPREILPISTVLANFVHLLLALVVFFVFLLVVWLNTDRENFPFTWTLALLPVLLVLTLMFTMGMSFIVSALNVFYEDVKYVTSVALYLLFFLTPVMYFSENVLHRTRDMGALGEAIYIGYHLNPVAVIATSCKQVLLKPGPVDIGGQQIPASPLPLYLYLWTAAVCIVIFFAGYALFNRMKWRFVERP